MPEIKVGDIVQLKSGGPMMTVSAVSPFNGVMSATCIWFDDKKEVHGVFALATLNKDED